MVSQVSYLSWFPNIRCLNQHLHLSFLSAQSVAKRKRGKAGAKVKLQLAEPCGHAPGSRDPIGSRIALPSQTFFQGLYMLNFRGVDVSKGVFFFLMFPKNLE